MFLERFLDWGSSGLFGGRSLGLLRFRLLIAHRPQQLEGLMLSIPVHFLHVIFLCAVVEVLELQFFFVLVRVPWVLCFEG